MTIATITGPTCAGKSTVERELQRLGCGRAISHTTRLARSGERDGVDYHFREAAQFDALEANDEFIEIVNIGIRRYGMSKKALHDAQLVSENVVIVVDPHGAGQIRAYCEKVGLPVFSVWVDCGPAEQAKRFLARLEQELDGVVGNARISAQLAAQERLEVMLAKEVEWRHTASQGKIDRTWHYHKVLDSSARYSPKELASRILWSLPPATISSSSRASRAL